MEYLVSFHLYSRPTGGGERSGDGGGDGTEEGEGKKKTETGRGKVMRTMPSFLPGGLEEDVKAKRVAFASSASATSLNERAS